MAEREHETVQYLTFWLFSAIISGYWAHIEVGSVHTGTAVTVYFCCLSGRHGSGIGWGCDVLVKNVEQS